MPVRDDLKAAMVSYLGDLSAIDSTAVLDNDWEHKKIQGFVSGKGKALVSVAPNPIPVSALNNVRREIYTIVGSVTLFNKDKKEDTQTALTIAVDDFKEELHVAFDNNRATLWAFFSNANVISKNFNRVSLGSTNTVYAEDGHSAVIDFNVMVDLTRKVP